MIEPQIVFVNDYWAQWPTADTFSISKSAIIGNIPITWNQPDELEFTDKGISTCRDTLHKCS